MKNFTVFYLFQIKDFDCYLYINISEVVEVKTGFLQIDGACFNSTNSLMNILTLVGIELQLNYSIS